MAPSPRASGVRFKTRYTVLTWADADAFSHVLRAEFPGVRFMRAPYWSYFLIGDQRDDGTWNTTVVDNRSPDLHVPYVETMGDRSAGRFDAWVEPEGWEPRWEGPNDRGIHVIANEPDLQFTLTVSREVPCWGRPGRRQLPVARIEASYFPEQKEKLRFLNKVWRLLGKMTSNWVVLVDRDTAKPRTGPKRDYAWAGPDAVAWCLADATRTFDEDMRPAEPGSFA